MIVKSIFNYFTRRCIRCAPSGSDCRRMWVQVCEVARARGSSGVRSAVIRRRHSRARERDFEESTQPIRLESRPNVAAPSGRWWTYAASRCWPIKFAFFVAIFK